MTYTKVWWLIVYYLNQEERFSKRQYFQGTLRLERESDRLLHPNRSAD